MQSNEPKYIFVNGVMELNPNYGGQKQQTTVKDPSKALAVVSSTADIGAATQAQYEARGEKTQLSNSTVSSMKIMQSQVYLGDFQCDEIDGGEVLDGLSNVFAKYEVPIGLVNKLQALSEYHLNFIIDDSGSMTTVPMMGGLARREATPYMQSGRSQYLSRWEEVEDRIHVMIDMLAYIPFDKITIGFLNKKDILTLDHKGIKPEAFANNAHTEISKIFKKQPTGGTPLYRALNEAFNVRRECNTIHYVFTDGQPSDRSIEEVEQLILNRDTNRHALNLMSCSENAQDCDWMKGIEEKATRTSEIDDFASEREEVFIDQGPAFPFTKGLWLVCNLVAAINPDDLDAIDEKSPFTKGTLDNLLGRRTTLQEYQHYFSNHPHAKEYQHQYQEFCREDILAKDIVKKQGFVASYIAPYMPSNPLNFSRGYVNQQGYSSGMDTNISSAPPPPAYQEEKKSGYFY